MQLAGLNTILNTPLLWLGFLNPENYKNPAPNPDTGVTTYNNGIVRESAAIVTNSSEQGRSQNILVYPTVYSNPNTNPIPTRPQFANFVNGPINAGPVPSPNVKIDSQVGTIPPLIPREVLFGTPDYMRVKISPDGKFLSWMAPSKNILNVWVAPIPADHFNPRFLRGIVGKPITKEYSRGIMEYSWLYDNRTIVYARDEGGDENWKITTVDVITMEASTLTGGDNVQARVFATSHLRPEEIVIGINDRNPQYHDPYLLNLKTGGRELLFFNNNFTQIEFDWELRPRLAKKTALGGGEEYYINRGGNWVFYRRISSEDSLGTAPIGFDISGKILYWRDSTNRDKSALIWTDFDAMRARVLYAPTEADLGLVELDSRTGHPVGVTVNFDRQQWIPLGNSIATDLQYLKQLVPNDDMLIVDTSLDYSLWVILYISDRSPDRYYLYDRGSKQAKFLFSQREDLNRYALSRMTPVQILTRDGLTQMCYLSLPLESDPNGRGRPNRPLAMVLLVHGGPWDRDQWGYDPYVQLLGNRGYAVLQCNFRGSTGFGKGFVNAGDREWGGKMQTDLMDAVAYAVVNRIADPSRIAVMGGSYGGYATLAGLTMTPDAFACGVDVVGPSNLITLMDTLPDYWKPELEMFIRRIGDHTTAEGREFLKSRSPFFFADRIKKPLLIAQGANDPRVKQNESDQIVDAMKRSGLPVTYLIFPDEGHGFLKHENNMAFIAIAEQFLAKCLGGRWEGGKVEGSSMNIAEAGSLSVGSK